MQSSVKENTKVNELYILIYIHFTKTYRFACALLWLLLAKLSDHGTQRQEHSFGQILLLFQQILNRHAIKVNVVLSIRNSFTTE